MSSSTLAKLGFASILLGSALTAQSQYWVSPTGSDANAGTSASPFLTINYANSVAANGDIINVTAGTYGDEQGIVTLGDKDVLVRGAGQGVTTIQAHSTLTYMADGGFFGTWGTPVPTTYRSAVVVDGTAFVQITNMTLDGANNLPATGRLHGLFVLSGADALVDRVEVVNCRMEPLNGNQRPAGIVIRGDNAADSCEIEITNCLVTDWGKSGIVALFNTDMVMDSNIVDGSGHTSLLAQNAVQYAYDAKGRIRNNTVTDVFYTPTTIAAAGFLGFSAGRVFVTDNFVGNCEGAIFMSTLGPNFNTGTISRNTTVASRFAISMEGVRGYSISDNVCHIISDDFPAAFDSGGANNWDGNRYSDFDGTVPFPILGGTSDLDDAASDGVREIDGVIATALGEAPVDLVTGDWNNDGVPDFATCNASQTLSIGIGVNDGTFTVTTIPAFGASAPVAMVTGEFDGAAGADLAVVSDQLYVFTGDNAGTFTAAAPVSLAMVTNPSDIAAGELSGDGLDDLVVTGASAVGQAVTLVASGGGAFLVGSMIPALAFSPIEGAAIGDLNEDGINDLVLVAGDNTVGRYLVFQGFNTGAFSIAISQGTTNLNPTEALVDDINGDGKNDFLVMSSQLMGEFGSVEVFENCGGFAFMGTQVLVDYGPAAMAVGDIDTGTSLDGITRRDVAVASATAGNTTLLGRYNLTGFSSGGICDTSTTPVGVAFGQFNGDGFVDLLVADAGSQEVRVLIGRPTASVELYSEGCPGTGGLTPTLVTQGLPPLPVQPNATFGVRIDNAKPATVAIFAAGFLPAPVLVPCGLLVSNISNTWWEITDASGSASIPLAIPATPNLEGSELFVQGGAFDPANTTGFVPGFSLTPGMRLRVGTY